MNKKASKKSARRKPWFVALRGSYLPCAWQGWLLYVPYVSMLLASYSFYKNNADSFFGLVLSVLPVWVALTVIITWIASATSK